LRHGPPRSLYALRAAHAHQLGVERKSKVFTSENVPWYCRVVCDILDPMVTGHTGFFRTHMIAQRPRSSVRARRPPHAAMSHNQHRGRPPPDNTRAGPRRAARLLAGVRRAWRRRRLFSRFAAFVYCSHFDRRTQDGRGTTEESLLWSKAMEKTSRGSARWSMPGEEAAGLNPRRTPR
jgi:hypothetical protein